MEEIHVPAPAPLARRAAPFVAAVVFGALGIGYAVHEHHSARSLATENQQMVAQLNATHGELDALVAKVDSIASSTEAKPAPKVPAKPSPKTLAVGSAVAHRAGERRADSNDERFGKLQSQFDAQGKAIDEARSDLTNTRTKLNSSIAKTHDELVLLEKKGERSYVEFDLVRSKQFKRTGPVSVSLRKANVKRGYADLQLIVEDRTLTQKHVNLYQPAIFYKPDSQQPVEIVINSITKNHVHGYISVAKYSQSELGTVTDTASARQKLLLPHDSGPVQP